MELADERSSGESASQMLETEAAERLRLDRELREQQVRLCGDDRMASAGQLGALLLHLGPAAAAQVTVCF